MLTQQFNKQPVSSEEVGKLRRELSEANLVVRAWELFMQD